MGIFLTVTFLLLHLNSYGAGGTHYVRSCVKKDGTYVQGH